MSKIITEQEILEILTQAIANPDQTKWAYLDGQTHRDAYRAFLRDVGQLVEHHFGGQFERLGDPSPEDKLAYTLSFAWNRYVPYDGGIYATLDQDCGLGDWQDESG